MHIGIKWIMSARVQCAGAAPSSSVNYQQRNRLCFTAQVSQSPPGRASSRSDLGCDHFGQCSGCALENRLSEPPVLDMAAAFLAAQGHPGLQLHVGDVQRWRHRARLAVRRDSAGGVAVGLFKRGTHEAVDIPGCRVHHPAINEAAELVRSCILLSGVEPYEEHGGRGQLRYLQLAVVRGGPEAGRQQVQAVLVWNAPAAAEAEGLAEFANSLWAADRRQQHPLLHSIVANFQPARSNAILGPAFRLLHGPQASAWALVGGAAICFDPGSFMQANPAAMDAALAAMRQFVEPGSNVVDLHAGVGTIGLSLAATRQLAALRLVEINPSAEASFWQSWRQLRVQQRPGLPAAVEYHAAAAGSDPRRWLAGADVAIVDPPRKGLEAELLAFLCREEPGAGAAGPPAPPSRLRRLIYLSCGWPAFERDCAALLGSGRWALAAAKAFLFFPGSDHIETLAMFDRQ